MTAPYDAPHPPTAGVPIAVPPRTGVALASLICAIAGLVTSIVWLLSIPLGFIAVVLGAIGCAATSRAPERQGRYQAIAGLIVGGMALIVGLLSALWWFPAY